MYSKLLYLIFTSNLKDDMSVLLLDIIARVSGR